MTDTNDSIVSRIVNLFDEDVTAGAFLSEDGDGGYAGAVHRMAREIERLRTLPLDASGIEIAARRVVGAASTTYRKRNGQVVTLEGDDGEMSYIVSFDDMEDLRVALFEAPPAVTTEKVFAQIVECAVAIAFQAGVGSLETAGQIVSFLARRPELLPAFMDGSLDPVDTGLLDHHNGTLTWHGADGKIYGPDPSMARFPAERQVAPVAFDLSTFTSKAAQKAEFSR